MGLTSYGKREWLMILLIGGVVIVIAILLKWYGIASLLGAITLSLLSFFRDPHRDIPSMRGQMVSPADGVISSIHELEHFEPFDGPAVCIRIFLSVLDVHVNRMPCHGRVVSMQHKPGQYLNALKAESAELNESLTIVIHHPQRAQPIAAVRQVSGAIARRIVCAATEGQIYQRGQRYGMIKFGSTTELYLPNPETVDIQVEERQRVYGGHTVLAQISPGAIGNLDEDAPGAIAIASSARPSVAPVATITSAATPPADVAEDSDEEAERRRQKYEPIITRTAADPAEDEVIESDLDLDDASEIAAELEDDDASASESGSGEDSDLQAVSSAAETSESEPTPSPISESDDQDSLEDQDDETTADESSLEDAGSLDDEEVLAAELEEEDEAEAADASTVEIVEEPRVAAMDDFDLELDDEPESEQEPLKAFAEAEEGSSEEADDPPAPRPRSRRVSPDRDADQPGLPFDRDDDKP